MSDMRMRCVLRQHFTKRGVAKRTYATEADTRAELALPRSVNKHAYLCPVCGGWHVGVLRRGAA